ncbi:TetR/AcrR family transcriptional regulator [Papillibacter cinnamivorans]|uniref:Transcriptional regulator, TetR family n=1 Tax=Papillibacter cinnamivorans DSM 12816 TaxID=1122930 RepID=A0A1W2AXP1_9FIRM|nr:TetR/AcrR family transcriptional regulator [Papillibacter cinnamivorans]SMC65453.1 transcriptional regulator, TetR family [Papillibacter cinnamivorans DSM 12816]
MNKKREMIEAAAVLIRSKGYENTKLSDILEATDTGKGQFYYYFASKRELGLAVLDYNYEYFHRNLLLGVLGSGKAPEVKFDEMLKWVVSFHGSMQAKSGCIFGNLTLEMSEHDEAFRAKLTEVFEAWSENLRRVLDEMFEPRGTAEAEEVNRLAGSIVGMIEGGILLMKSRQDIAALRDVTDWIRFLVASYASGHRAG